jgi:hypothetical protein
VLVDLSLPDGDGFDLVYSIRAARDVPIIVVTARRARAEPSDGLALAGAARSRTQTARGPGARATGAPSPYEGGEWRRPDVDLLNPQVYPDRRNPDGTPEAPYDMAGWTPPYQMGVTVDKVTPTSRWTARRSTPPRYPRPRSRQRHPATPMRSTRARTTRSPR